MTTESYLRLPSCVYRFRLWVDEIAKLFGGLDIAAVKAIRARDGTEYIIEASQVFELF